MAILVLSFRLWPAIIYYFSAYFDMVCNQILKIVSKYTAFEVGIIGYVAPSFSFLGVICNILNIWVLTDKRLRKSSTFTFLTYLSASDIVTCLVLLGGATTHIHFAGTEWAEHYAIYTWSIIAVSSNWSVLLTAAITIDRCLHIIKPHRGEDFEIYNRTVNRAHIISFLVLIIAIAINAPRIFIYYFDSEVGCKRQFSWAAEPDGWFYSYSVVRLIVYKLGKITFSILIVRCMYIYYRDDNNYGGSKYCAIGNNSTYPDKKITPD